MNKILMKSLIAVGILLLNCSMLVSQNQSMVTAESYDHQLPTTNSITDETVVASNVILLIGDGMGLSQISSAFYFKPTVPNYARFRHIGLMKTSSTVRITDSAAGATAFASGKKTYNGAIGVDADTVNIPNLVEILSEDQWNTGLIATSSITHATPACFYAHVKSRRLEEEIAEQLTTSEVDFVAGGGVGYFTDSVRADGKDLLKRFEENGFQVNTEHLPASADPEKKYAFLKGHPALPSVVNGRGDFLATATGLALDHLSSGGNNFFLMVEGSMIDWGGHANDAEYLVTEMIDFDDAIGEALDFAREDGNTLVIVTADHETGGFTLSSGISYNQIKGTFSTGGHSTTLIPVAAYGPGSELFSGIYENTEIFHKILQAVSNEKSN